MNTPAQETFKERLEKYKRREQQTIWVAAGLAGVLGVLGLDIVNETSPVLLKVILTLLIIGAGSLAYARAGFEWAAITLERKAKSEPGHFDKACNEDWPSCEKYWTIALVTMSICGVLLIITIWFPIDIIANLLKFVAQ